MKRLIVPPRSLMAEEEDCHRIIMVCMKNDYEIDMQAAAEAWRMWSDRSEAQWLSLPPDDDVLLACILAVTEAHDMR